MDRFVTWLVMPEAGHQTSTRSMVVDEPSPISCCKGDAPKLNSFISELRELKGIGMRLVLYRGRDDESRRDSAWQLDYSHARPNQVTIYLNLNAPELDFYKIKFPEWPSN